MMDCREIDAVMDRWERGGEVSAKELEGLREHLSTCARCAAAKGSLANLLGRDSGADRRGATPSARFVDSVMAKISAEALPASGKPEAPIRFRRLAYAAFAAAAALAIWIGASRMAGGAAGGDTVIVRFTLAAPEARSVAVAGDFNDWDASTARLERKRDGGPWELELRLKKDSLYSYNFVIDGERWILDPSTVDFVEDGFGGSSSLIRL
jgi:hypothetical protein